MNGSLLNRASQVKYLGIIIDHKLNYILHKYVKNKIAKGVGIMYKAKRFLNKACLTNLYHTYIYPCLVLFIVLRFDSMKKGTRSWKNEIAYILSK